MKLEDTIQQWVLSIQAGGQGSGRRKTGKDSPKLWERLKSDAGSILIPSGYGGADVDAGGPGSGRRPGSGKGEKTFFGPGARTKDDKNWDASADVEAGGPGSGRHKGDGAKNFFGPSARTKDDNAFDRDQKRFAVLVKNPSHNGGRPFVTRSFDNRDEADGHARKMMGDLPHLSTHVHDRGSKDSGSALRDFMGDDGFGYRNVHAGGPGSGRKPGGGKGEKTFFGPGTRTKDDKNWDASAEDASAVKAESKCPCCGK